MAIPSKNVLGNPNVTEGNFQIAIEQLRESVIGSGKTYDSANTYMAYDICYYSGVVYYSKIDSNIGNTPSIGANWGDYADLLSGVVHKTGDEKIAGVKTFSDNVGIGTTPSAWYTAGLYTKAIDIGNGEDNGAIWSSLNRQHSHIGIGANFYYNNSLIPTYKGSYAASEYVQELGAHYWLTAPSGIAGNPITWNTAMKLESSGRLLIGTTTDNGYDSLQINGSIGVYGQQYNIWNNSTVHEIVNRGNVAKTFTWYVGAFGNAPVATLSTSGVWTNASDIRNKTNIKDISYGLDTVMALSPKEYDLKSDGTHGIGFIAQEVKNIIPELVFGDEDKSYLTLDYASMVTVLTKAVQEQQAQIEELKLLIEGKQNGN